MQSLWAHKRRHPHSAVRCNYQSQTHSVCDPFLTGNTDWWPSWVETPSVGSLSTRHTHPPPPLSKLSFFLNIFIWPKTPTWSLAFEGKKGIYNLNHQVPWLVLRIIHNQRFITPCCYVGQRNMTPYQRVAEGVGLWSKEVGEERTNLTQLAWLAIIAPSLSVLERPSCSTIWTQLPAVYQWPLCPSPHPLLPLETPPVLPVWPMARMCHASSNADAAH